MRVKILQDANVFVLNTTIKTEDIQLLKSGNPNALKEFDDEGNEVFAINYEEGEGCITDFGITFGKTSADGTACVSARGYLVDEDATEDIEALKEAVIEIFLPIQPHLEKLEASVPEAVTQLKATKTTLSNLIEVL